MQMSCFNIHLYPSADIYCLVCQITFVCKCNFCCHAALPVVDCVVTKASRNGFHNSRICFNRTLEISEVLMTACNLHITENNVPDQHAKQGDRQEEVQQDTHSQTVRGVLSHWSTNQPERCR